MPSKVWKTRKFDFILRLCKSVYVQKTTVKRTKDGILPFPKKGDRGITQNYRCIKLTAIAAEVYNALLLNQKSKNFLGKIRIVFEENDLHPHRFWQSIESSMKYVQIFSRQHFCLQISPRNLISYIHETWRKYDKHIVSKKKQSAQ